jgi:dihydroorotase
MTLRQLTIRRPDDWHAHLRDGDLMRAVISWSAPMGRVIAMPNRKPPVTTVDQALEYGIMLREALPPGSSMEPLVTAYLTDKTSAEELQRGYDEGAWVAAKLYPANATTNSADGVTDVSKIEAPLRRMAEIGMPLLVHGEVTHPDVDFFDREQVFLHQVLGPLLDRIPDLRCVVEHATTRVAVEFVRRQNELGRTVAATFTPHHLWWNRNALFDGGLRPHVYCLPIPKRREDQLVLRKAATSGEEYFFAGTDTAPHRVVDKEKDCGCAGTFCAPTAVPTYAEVFEQEGKLDRLEGFLSEHGATFYRRPLNEDKVRLVWEAWTPPKTIPVADGQEIRVFRGGESVACQMLAA